MTSAPIVEVSQTGYVPSRSAAKTGGSTEAVQFSKAMDFASAGGQTGMSGEPGIQGSGTGSDVKTHAEKNVAENTGRKEIRSAGESEKTETATREEAVEELEEKTEKIVEEIAEALDVSPEEVEEAMETLGLTVMDLLSQGNMAALVAELKDVPGVELLTDADLFSQITRLTAEVQEGLKQLADSLGMAVEELEQMIKEQILAADEMAVTEEVSQQAAVTDITTGADDAEMQMMAAETVEKQVQPSERNGDSKEAVSASETTDETMIGDDATEFVQKQSETGDDGFKGFREDAGRQQETLQGGLLSGQTVAGNISGAGNPAMDNLFAGEFDLQQTRELIDQIADYVRVHHSEKVSSMEIQLNPASLGSVSLQVVAKDGVISAQLAAQDEAVRAALESQITQLKESLEAQGLKVDAVEVTTQSHAFEQNLQQQDKNSEQQAERAKKNARKILNLDEMDQEEMLDEEISDADRLQIEMMRMGGNKLNFRV